MRNDKVLRVSISVPAAMLLWSYFLATEHPGIARVLISLAFFLLLGGAMVITSTPDSTGPTDQSIGRGVAFTAATGSATVAYVALSATSAIGIGLLTWWLMNFSLGIKPRSGLKSTSTPKKEVK